MKNIFLFLMVPFYSFTWASQCNTTLSTSSCPKDAIAWHRRGTEFECDTFRNITYHCILNEKGLLKEACIRKEVILQGEGGCPWILEYNRQPYISRPLSSCPFDLDGCPQRDHTQYTTDLLYLYKTCLIPVDQRNASATTNKDDNPSTTKTTVKLKKMTSIIRDIENTRNQNTFENESKECSVTALIILIVFFAFACVIQLPISIYFLITSMQKMEKKRSGGTSKSENGEDDYLLERPTTADYHQSHESIASKAFHNPVDMKDSFIERNITKEIKNHLENIVSGSGDEKMEPIVLLGMRGSGKSCSAIHCLESLELSYFVIEAGKENHLRKSLKKLADDHSLDDAFVYSDLEKSIKVMSEMLMKSDIVLLIEDVMSTEIVSLLDPFIKKCKCIITTHDKRISNIFESVHSLQVPGLTSKEAKQLFKQSNVRTSETDEELSKLVDALDGSPFGLKIVISFMKERNLSVKGILEYLSQHKGVSAEGDSLFIALDQFVEYILSVYSEVSTLLFALQFVHSKDIPIILFQALAAYDKCQSKKEQHSNPFNRANTLVDTFVSVLRRVSFGDVQGEDNDRFITVQKIAQYSISRKTKDGKRREIYLKLLKCLSWLFLKDHGHTLDHQRCLALLSHATEIIHHYPMQITSVPIDEALVFVQVCDQVRHTYDVLGYASEEKNYAKVMKEFFLKHLLKNRGSDFLRSVMNERANATAAFLMKQINTIVNENKQVIAELAGDYIRFKVRSHYDIENLRKKLKEHDIPMGSGGIACGERLSCEEITWLKDRNLIIKDECLLARVFVYEVFMSAMNVFGQFALCYDKNFELFRSFVNLSICLAKDRMFHNFPSVRTVGIELIGIKTLRLTELEQGVPKAKENLRTSIHNVKQFLLNDKQHFKYGLYVLCPKENIDHQLRCHAVLLEYHKACKEQNETSEEAEQLKSLFQQKFEELKAVPHSQQVKQLLVKYLMEKDDFGGAQSILISCPHHEPSKTVSKYDCEDILLLFKCYEHGKQLEEMKTLWAQVTFSIPSDEETAKSIIKQIKEIKRRNFDYR